MFRMFRRLFSRKRQCPECGFQGSPRDFKRVKNTPKVSDARDAADYGTEADKKAFGVGQTGTAGATGGNVGTGNVGASGGSKAKARTAKNKPKVSDARDAADYGAGQTGATGSAGSKSK